jgi:MFS transporter, putative metabolite:H+ symporter
MLEHVSRPHTAESVIDKLPMTGLHKKIVTTVSVIFFFEFADLNAFAYAAPALRRHEGYALADIAMVTSAGFLGMFLGAVAAGRLADRLGRRRTLCYATVVFSVFSLLTAAAANVEMMVALRFCTGIGLSAMTVAAISYLSEMMPASVRGRAQGTTLAVGLAGIPAIAFFARGVIPVADDGWRLIFVAGGLALLSVPLLARLPESPRWLLQAGRRAQADDVIAQLGGDCSAISASHDRATTTDVDARPLAMLIRKPLRRRTLVLIATWVLAMLGFYAFAAWVPSLLAEHDLSLTKSLTFSAITTLGAVPGALLARAISDRYSRKWLMAAASMVIAACGIAYGFSSSAVGIIVFGLLVSLVSQTFVAFIYAYTPEALPTVVRSTGCGISYGAGRLANVIGPLLIPAIYASLGYTAVFVAVALCWVGSGLIVATLGPETSRRSLEDI